MSRSYTSSPPSASVACSGTALTAISIQFAPSAACCHVTVPTLRQTISGALACSGRTVATAA
jgi:hypothetical protein